MTDGGGVQGRIVPRADPPAWDPGAPALALARRIAALDLTLFDELPGPGLWDRRALLALHAAVAARRAPFGYLEIGSYLGGSLQVLMRDPRCARVLSVDPRPDFVPDVRGGSCDYPDNSTQHMRELLATVPGADVSKLVTFECDSSELTLSQLGPEAPALSFVDGEHTDAAVLRDGRFCAEALRGRGVVAFHDRELVRDGLMALLSELWPEISAVVGFGDTVLAVELGDDGVLGDRLIPAAVGSRWHLALWRMTSRARSPRGLQAAWRAMPSLDRAAARLRGASVRTGTTGPRIRPGAGRPHQP